MADLGQQELVRLSVGRLGAARPARRSRRAIINWVAVALDQSRFHTLSGLPPLGVQASPIALESASSEMGFGNFP